MDNINEETERKFIVGLKAQDKTIFKFVYDFYWSKLYVSAFNLLRDREQAEDVVQEVFSHLWKSAPQLDIRNISAWLFTSVRYQVFNVIRSGKVRSRFENLHIIEEYSSNIAELKLDNEDIHRRLMDSLNELPPRCREIFELSRFQHLSYREIAKKLDLSEKTIENQISIALKKLRISLKDLSFMLVVLLVV